MPRFIDQTDTYYLCNGRDEEVVGTDSKDGRPVDSDAQSDKPSSAKAQDCGVTAAGTPAR